MLSRLLIGSLFFVLAASGCSDGKTTGDSNVSCGNGTELVDGECVVTNQTACGSGTVLVGGNCVPDDTVLCAPGTTWVDGECVPDATCGDGTILVGTECVPESTVTCAAGTELIDEQCVPVKDLAGFEVVAVPADCGFAISGYVPVNLTVTALDVAGGTLETFDGTLGLMGLGGITLDMATIALTDGVATAELNVGGAGEEARIAVANLATGVDGGISAPFEVQEPILGATLSAPATVRAEVEFSVTIDLAYNGCVAADDHEGPINLWITDGMIHPAMFASDGASTTGVVHITDVMDVVTSNMIVDVAGAGAQSSVELIPTIEFAGIDNGWGLADAQAQLLWSAAMGGTGTFTYEVFTALTPDTFDFDAPAATTDLIDFVLTGIINDVPTYIVVRAVDGFDDGSEDNRRMLVVVAGNVRYVDPANTAGTQLGTSDDPFTTLADALASPATTIIIAAATYEELSAAAPLLVVGGVSLLGGFDPSDWTLSGSRSVLTLPAAATNPAFSPAVFLGAGVRLSGFSIEADMGTGNDLVVVENSSGLPMAPVQIHDANLTPGTGRGLFIDVESSQDKVYVSSSTIQGNGGDCLSVNLGSVDVDAIELINCGQGIVTTGESVHNRAQATLSGLIVNAPLGIGLALTQTDTTITGSMFINGGSTAIYSSEGTLSVTDSFFDTFVGAAIFTENGQEHLTVLGNRFDASGSPAAVASSGEREVVIVNNEIISGVENGIIANSAPGFTARMVINNNIINTMGDAIVVSATPPDDAASTIEVTGNMLSSAMSGGLLVSVSDNGTAPIDVNVSANEIEGGLPAIGIGFATSDAGTPANINVIGNSTFHAMSGIEFTLEQPEIAGPGGDDLDIRIAGNTLLFSEEQGITVYAPQTGTTGDLDLTVVDNEIRGLEGQWAIGVNVGTGGNSATPTVIIDDNRVSFAQQFGSDAGLLSAQVHGPNAVLNVRRNVFSSIFAEDTTVPMILFASGLNPALSIDENSVDLSSAFAPTLGLIYGVNADSGSVTATADANNNQIMGSTFAGILGMIQGDYAQGNASLNHNNVWGGIAEEGMALFNGMVLMVSGSSEPTIAQNFSASIIGNEILSGTDHWLHAGSSVPFSPAGLFVDMGWGEAMGVSGVVNLDIAGNHIESLDSAMLLGIANMAGSGNIDIHNNVLVTPSVRDSNYPYTLGFGLGGLSADFDVDVTQNTILGTAIGVGFEEMETGASVTLEHNIVQSFYEEATFGFEAIEALEFVTADADLNIFSDGYGPAIFLSQPTSYLVTRPGRGGPIPGLTIVEVAGTTEHIEPGDQVLFAGEDLLRNVVDVDPEFNILILDGGELAFGIMPAIHWSGRGTPEGRYRLQRGSPGSAVDPMDDWGAYGGPGAALLPH